MKSMNSNTEPGQPCINRSGVGLGPFPGTCRKCRSVSGRVILNCGKAFRRASCARQSKDPRQVVDEAAKIVDVRPVEPRLARRGIGKTGARETLAQVRNVAVGNAQCEWLRHRLLRVHLTLVEILEWKADPKSNGAWRRSVSDRDHDAVRRIDPLQPEGDGHAMQTHYNTLAGGEVGRIAALSDGLFAIAATILVLDFHTPEPARHPLRGRTPPCARELLRRGSCRGC